MTAPWAKDGGSFVSQMAGLSCDLVQPVSRTPPESNGVAPGAAWMVRPESAGPKMIGSTTSCRPEVSWMVTLPVPASFLASARALAVVAKGPSLRNNVGEALRPDHVSLPSGET